MNCWIWTCVGKNTTESFRYINMSCLPDYICIRHWCGNVRATFAYFIQPTEVYNNIATYATGMTANVPYLIWTAHYITKLCQPITHNTSHITRCPYFIVSICSVSNYSVENPIDSNIVSSCFFDSYYIINIYIQNWVRFIIFVNLLI